MNDNQEYLYTDYAMQIFTAFLNKESMSIADLMNTFEDELDDPTFVPGLLFAFLIHMESLFTSIADANDESVSETYQKYVLYYDSIRGDLMEISPLRPSFAKSAIEEMKKELGW